MVLYIWQFVVTLFSWC